MNHCIGDFLVVNMSFIQCFSPCSLSSCAWPIWIFHCYQASWFLQICRNIMPVMLKSAFTVMSDTNLPVVIFHISWHLAITNWHELLKERRFSREYSKEAVHHKMKIIICSASCCFKPVWLSFPLWNIKDYLIWCGFFFFHVMEVSGHQNGSFEYHLLCSVEDRKPWRFRMTRVNNWLFFGWTVPKTTLLGV